MTAGPDENILYQLLPWLVFSAVLGIPYFRILRRAGRSGWWLLLLLIPGFGWLVLPWTIAFMRWDRRPEKVGDVFR